MPPMRAPGTSGTSPRWFKRAQRGLYAGCTRLTGNHVSDSKRHVRRTWLPNVHAKTLWSDTLNRGLRINVTTTALRWIDRAGGLDNYLLHTQPHKLASVRGVQLRTQLEKQIKFRAKLEAKYGPGAGGAGKEVEAGVGVVRVQGELR